MIHLHEIDQVELRAFILDVTRKEVVEPLKSELKKPENKNKDLGLLLYNFIADYHENKYNTQADSAKMHAALNALTEEVTEFKVDLTIVKGDIAELKTDVAELKTDMAIVKETMATKEDLKQFATKEDLKQYATKEDLKKFATKEDMKQFATKEDLKNMAEDIVVKIGAYLDKNFVRKS